MSILFNIFDGLLTFYAYLLVGKYVFFEKGLKGKSNVTYYAVISLGIIITSIFSSSLGTDISFAALVGWLLLQRKEKRIRAVFISFPIVGIIKGLLLPIVQMPPVLIDPIANIADLYEVIMSGVLAGCVIFFTLWIERRDKVNLAKLDVTLGSEMDLDSHNRKLSRNEKLLLYFVGVFEVFFSTVIQLPFDMLSKLTIPESVIQELYTGMELEENYEFVRSLIMELGGDMVSYSMKVIVFLLGVATFFMTSVVITVVLINNKRSFYHNRVADIQFNVIVTMADIVENRDADTGGHIQRTAKYVEIIAEQMRISGPYMDKMTPKFMEDIRIAAPLHDIGKIHVPDSILNYPGRLSDEQFAIMKTHAIAGRNLLIKAKQRLGDFSYLDVSIDMAGYHHEWWDGSAKGYPTGISGEKIPLCARIMAVADVFDALTAKRVYKDPMPVEKAIDIILSEKGTHFDPYIIDAFMEAIDQIKSALKEFEDAAVANTDVDLEALEMKT